MAYITAAYPPFGAGGAEVTIPLHARLMVESGRSVTVLTPNYGAASREIIDGVEIVRLPYDQKGAPGKAIEAREFQTLTIQEQFADKIVETLRGRSIACLHAQTHHLFVASDIAAKRLGVPLVTHVRDTSSICLLGAVCLLENGVDHPPPSCGRSRHASCYVNKTIPLYWPNAPLRGKLSTIASLWRRQPDLMRRQAVLAGSARVAFASEALRQIYGRLRHVHDDGHHRVVYAPVLENSPIKEIDDPTRLPPPVRDAKTNGFPIILFVGKATIGKGFDVLLAAHQRLLETIPNARLVVAGNIEPGQWTLGPSVVPLGFVDRETIARLYQTCDLVAMPSTWPEPLGWPTLDAGKYGKPIAATRVGGVAEAVIDGETGILVQRRDVLGLAAAMASLIAEPVRAVAMGDRARNFVVSKFGAAAVKKQLADLYLGLERQPGK